MNDDTTTPPTSDQQIAPAPRRRRRVGLIAGIAAAGLGVIALTSGVTLAVADEWQDDDDRTELVADRDETDGGSSAPGGDATSDDATASADDFAEALTAAIAAADGTGAEGIEAERDGWSVDVIRADGTEVDVRVTASGGTTVGEQSPADAAGSFDEAALRSAIDAALGHTDGEVHAVELTGDAGTAYSVSVIAGGVETELLLDDAFAVTGTDD